MKRLTIIFLIFICTKSFAQNDTFDILMANGKAEFGKAFEDQDFNLAIKNLTKALNLRPGSAEAHYFLGYAYSRLNSKDGETLIEMTLPILLKASEQFEVVNKLEPKYSGQSLALNPYSKIMSEWGSMAMKYLYNKKIDSAKWAFTEGKMRGGFSSVAIQSAKNALNACAKNSILLSYGDGWTFPLWYLQYVDGYRTDVGIIDVGLINAVWYPNFLINNKIVDFGLPIKEINSLTHQEWEDQRVEIKNIKHNNSFAWNIKPTIDDAYLGRGELLLLALLKKNQFQRDIYFTRLFDDGARLSLSDKIIDGISVDRLNTGNEKTLPADLFKTELLNTLALVKLVNFNNQEEINMMSSIRYPIYVEMKKCIEDGKYTEARNILQLMNDYLPYDKFPTSDGFKVELNRVATLLD